MKSAARQGNATAVRASDRSSLAAGIKPGGGVSVAAIRLPRCTEAVAQTNAPLDFSCACDKVTIFGRTFRPRRTRSGRLRRSHEAGEIGRRVIRTRGLVCATASTRSSSRRSPRDVAAIISPLGQSPAAWSISSASGLTPTRFGATIHVLVGDSQLMTCTVGRSDPARVGPDIAPGTRTGAMRATGLFPGATDISRSRAPKRPPRSVARAVHSLAMKVCRLARPEHVQPLDGVLERTRHRSVVPGPLDTIPSVS
jgi:hypothetical protein